MGYPNVPAQPNFPALEQSVLERWERDRTFLESILRREDEDDLDVSSLIDQTREAGDTTSPVERPEPADETDDDGPHDLFSTDDR